MMNIIKAAAAVATDCFFGFSPLLLWALLTDYGSIIIILLPGSGGYTFHRSQQATESGPPDVVVQRKIAEKEREQR